MANPKADDEMLNRSTIEAAWSNPSDEKAAEFYRKKYR